MVCSAVVGDPVHIVIDYLGVKVCTERLFDAVHKLIDRRFVIVVEYEYISGWSSTFDSVEEAPSGRGVFPGEPFAKRDMCL